mgnify:CR=1 FL=1
MKNKTYNKKKILIVFLAATVMILGLIGRLCYLMNFGRGILSAKRRKIFMRENGRSKRQEGKL